MKREKPDYHIDNNPHRVVKHYSFFDWYDCDGCNKQFRREKGWRWEKVGYWGYFEFRYACRSCANSIKECNVLIDKIEEQQRINNKNKMPNTPPTSPPMRGYDGRRISIPMPEVKPPRKDDES